MSVHNPNIGSYKKTSERSVPSESIAEHDLSHLSSAEVYQLFHDYYDGHDGLDKGPSVDYPVLVGEWVLHRNHRTRDDDRDWRMIMRATPDAFRQIQREHVSGQEGTLLDPVRNSHYHESELFIALTNGEDIYEPHLTSLIGKSDPRGVRRDLQQVSISFEVAQSRFLQMQLNQDMDSGWVRLPGGELGWIIPGEESGIEISHTLPAVEQGHDTTSVRIAQLALSRILHPPTRAT